MAPDSEPDALRMPDASPRDLFPPLEFLLKVEDLYASLICHAATAEAGLGGRLLYVGELDDDGRALMVAANIAGTASLAVTSDPIAGKQAIRDGVADFLVTNLDEALRILKNEIRKREAVAVCITNAPEATEKEMVERGVQPDLIRNIRVAGDRDLGEVFGGKPGAVARLAPIEGESRLSWGVEQAPAQWLPRLDALAIECFTGDEGTAAQIARRWIRLAPRYLGRLARNVRVLRCPTAVAEAIAERMRAGAETGEIAVPVRIEFV